MKSYILPILLATAAGITASSGILNKWIPWLVTQSGTIVKEEQTKIIKENIEEYKKVSNLESDVTKAIEKVSPSIVRIIATKDLEAYIENPLWFASRKPILWVWSAWPKSGIFTVWWASGIITSKDGYIITNKHAVSDITAQYSVITADGTTYTVRSIWTDPLLDIAMLSIVDEKWRVPVDVIPASFASLYAPVRVGQFVVSIWNVHPEYPNSATFGIISAKNTVLNDQKTWLYIGLYQTDSALREGNSWGPLVTIQWDIIGMNTAVSRDVEKLWFALPLTKEFIQSSLHSLSLSGSIIRPYLGIKSLSLSKARAKKMNLTKFDGVLISDIAPWSPAEKAGLLSGDVITKIQWDNVVSDMPFLYSLYSFSPWDTISFLVYRWSEYVKVDAILSSWSVIQ
jgi:serine protease Do